MHDATATIGRRVLVIGMAGAGKSTFSRVLAAKTGLALVHLDLEYWKPGWTKPSEDEWRAKQRRIFAADAWIADGNYYDSLDVQLERAESVVVLETPWWLCASRAFRRGIRAPGRKMPEGCEESVMRRLRDEWGIVGRVWMGRHSEPARARAMMAEHGPHVAVHVLRSKQEAQAFLESVNGK